MGLKDEGYSYPIEDDLYKAGILVFNFEPP
jgi:hypothetical protein